MRTINGFWAPIFLTISAHAEVVPSALFCDHMVLQRGMAVPIWGSADPGEEVTVAFGGQVQSIKAGEDGGWMLRLDELEGSAEGREMKITGGNEIIIKDVVVGEVWICSGQSNMQMVSGTVPELKELEPEAGRIRSFHVKQAVAFEPKDNVTGVWKNQTPNSAVASGFSIFLEKAIDVPVGIILNPWGSTSLEAWMPRDLVDKIPAFKRQVEEFEADAERVSKIKAIMDSEEREDNILMRRQSNIVYNGMMAPLVPFACRGLVWYQGERNAFNLDEIPKAPWYRRSIPMTGYGEAFKIWIQRYREEWGREDLHFLVVMLPGNAADILKDAESPNAKSWAWMREAQLEALELANTSVVNTIDLGHLTNIHPTDKLPIGQRLALLAQRDTLAMDVIAEGPVMKGVEIAGDSLVVSFENAQDLKTKDGNTPTGFWISGDDKKWFPAVSGLNGASITLSSPDLEEPKYIRYAFAGMPQTNLVNSAGLPARPFRTDSFKFVESSINAESQKAE